jgi:hypothetical protein
MMKKHLIILCTLFLLLVSSGCIGESEPTTPKQPTKFDVLNAERLENIEEMWRTYTPAQRTMLFNQLTQTPVYFQGVVIKAYEGSPLIEPPILVLIDLGHVKKGYPGRQKASVRVWYDETYYSRLGQVKEGDYMGVLGTIDLVSIDDYSVPYSLSIHGEQLSVIGG